MNENIQTNKMLKSIDNKLENSFDEEKKTNYFELIDNFTGMSVLVPNNWNVLNSEAMYKNATPNTIFIIDTDANAQIQAIYDCQCEKSESGRAYHLPLNQYLSTFSI